MKWIDKLLDVAIARRIRKSGVPLTGWQVKRVACWTCHLVHELPNDLKQALASAEGFFLRHVGHSVNWFEQPGVAGLWASNADVKVAYGSSAAYTITLASLATSSTLVVGRAGTAVSNTSNLYDDYLVGGKVTTGTSPTVDTQIEIDAYGSYADAPTYGDGVTGTDAGQTFTSANTKRTAVRLVERMFVDNTSNRTYPFGPSSLKPVFGWNMPKNHGIFVSHSTAVNLNSTGSNHEIIWTPVYQTVI